MLAAHAAPIYKVVDERTGQVTFTDSPQSYEQQADKQISQTGISTGSTTSNSSSVNAASGNRANTSVNNKQTGQPAAVPKPTLQTAVNYQLTMIEPKAERAYQRPGQIITVNLQLSPALQAGDSISIYLDDTLISQGITASIATIDLNPGEHTIQAIIKNSAGQIINRISRSVYVIQNTAILRQKQQLAQQLQAYQQLPWQQKLLLKLRQKESINNDSQ
ncbi:DUF4124 domain-containing protein [Psychrobacter sp. Ps3]|uniref:DUF4124 domain-containing protein n=1 Tax=Psychrobacter sp. Ps3 TaxID=2790957 RepID=UPI001EDF7841|nr:DUF4124 domain-containing protein [Psychrobacter sp. Ps3]MCG3883009.1 DUF4124 domain-containing protein [Psychrobacter sp. Ps3]